MRTRVLIALAATLYAVAFYVYATAPASAYRIIEDHGGRIGTYFDKYQALSNSGEEVIIDGPCASACTLALIVPAEHLCATPRAKLGFHQAWNPGGFAKNGGIKQVADRESSEGLFKIYPRPVRDWIWMHGGLPKPENILWLSGKVLRRFVRLCQTTVTRLE